MKSQLYFALGCIFFVIGMIGVFLPVMPTTPFLIVAAFFWARSSKKFYDWLINHRVFGPPIRDWQARGAIKLQVKVLATVMMVATPIITLFIDSVAPWMKVTYILIIGATLIFIWTRPS